MSTKVLYMDKTTQFMDKTEFYMRNAVNIPPPGIIIRSSFMPFLARGGKNGMAR